MSIAYRTDGAIARIAMDAPPVNAITMPRLEALLGAIRRAGEDNTIRAIVIESAVPRYFCAGLDLALMRDIDEANLRRMLNLLYAELLDVQFACGKPTIAAVAGAARGGGMTLAVSCNLIVAGEAASFGYPEIDVALPPAIHLAHLPEIVGRHRAYELLMTGRTFDAAEAHAMGLVARIARGSVIDAALDLARTLAAKPPEALRAAHAAFMRENDHRASVQRAIDLFCAEALSAHGRAGVASFADRRKR